MTGRAAVQGHRDRSGGMSGVLGPRGGSRTCSVKTRFLEVGEEGPSRANGVPVRLVVQPVEVAAAAVSTGSTPTVQLSLEGPLDGTQEPTLSIGTFGHNLSFE